MVFYQHIYDSRINFTLFDLVFIFVLLFAAVIYATLIKERKIQKEPFFKYYTIALFLKICSGVAFAGITLAYYPGDTFEYFMSINSLNKLCVVDFTKYLDIFINGDVASKLSYFNAETGFPSDYMWKDPNAVFVWRVYSPFLFLTSHSFIASSAIASIISFTGIWKLYKVFCNIYPHLKKQLAISVLFFPSLIFWSSGILKDTLTMSAIGWMVYSFYNLAIKKQLRIKFIVQLIFASVIVINIKSYIFAALLPGLFIWLFFGQLQSIKSKFIRFVFAPVLVVVVIVGFSLIMSRLSSNMGDYGDINKTLKKAQVTQQDLTRSEQYGENYYDIGEFEATPVGVLSKAPIAIVSGIFRPFIWEARNPFILLAALEGLFLMGFLGYALLKVGLLKFFRIIFSDPILIFSFSFVLIFGFGVGLATANFGALVRYKIPLLPFFTAGLYILIDRAKKRIESKDQIIV